MAGLQDVFNHLLLGKEIKLIFNSKQEYDSLRTSLIRKLRKASEGMESIGDFNPYREQFVKSSYSAETGEAVFQLAHKEQKARKSYNIGNL